jgi:hypothetical protein
MVKGRGQKAEGKGEEAEGRRQRVEDCCQVVSAVRSVLTHRATAIVLTPNP